MNPSDDFENQLHRRPIRPVPAAWRSEILAAAATAAQPVSSPIVNPKSQIVYSLLWPCPQAWAGLAAVWVCIFLFNFATRENNVTVTAQSPPPSPELIMALREQRRTLVKLIEPFEQPPAEPPKPFIPRPRGDRRSNIFTV